MRLGLVASVLTPPCLTARDLTARGLAAGSLVAGCLTADPSLAADSWCGRDKALHGGASFVLGAGGYAASSTFLDGWPNRALFGFSFSFSLGLAKEGYDWAGHGEPSHRDLAWDAAGALAGIATAALIDLSLPSSASAPSRGSTAGSSWRITFR